MTSRQRLLTALDHREPDRIPFDLGSTQVTGIHVVAYRRLRAHLRLPAIEPRICDVVQGLALPDDDIADRLGVDVRGLFRLNSHNWKIDVRDEGGYRAFVDEWGITYRRPSGRRQCDPVAHPLAEATIDVLDRLPWPDLEGKGPLLNLAPAVAVKHKGHLVRAFRQLDPGHLDVLWQGLPRPARCRSVGSISGPEYM